MKTLLSLPPNVVEQFHAVSGKPSKDYFCTSDPVGHKLGSGGGTTWLLEAAQQADGDTDFSTWLAREKRILLHAGNSAADTQGCILLGSNTRVGRLTDSRQACEHVYHLLLATPGPHTLTIR